jgi:hypothetical protein
MCVDGEYPRSRIKAATVVASMRHFFFYLSLTTWRGKCIKAAQDTSSLKYISTLSEKSAMSFFFLFLFSFWGVHIKTWKRVYVS